MIYGGIDPFAKPVLAEPFWVDLITGMTINIINDGKQEKYGKVQAVNRNGEKKNGDDAGFNKSFQRMKCVGGPG